MLNLKEKKGAIGLFVLISCMFFIISATSVYMYIQVKQVAVNKEYKEIKDNYEENIDLDGDGLNVKFETKSIGAVFSKTFTIENESLKIKSIKYGWSEGKDTLPTQWNYIEKDATTATASKNDITPGKQCYLFVQIDTNDGTKNFWTTQSIKDIKENGILNDNIVTEDKNGTKITIPAGFTIAKDSTEIADEGIVITDKVDDEKNSVGNEFVWVPCGDEGEKYEKKKGLAVTWKSKYSGKQNYYTTIATGQTNAGKTITDWRDNGGDESSVTKYGGFYVARFEAGVPSEATEFYANKEGDAYKTASAKNNSTYAPVSKKNNQCWNYISQINAKTVSAKMYENSSSVTSQLIDSYAWDTIVEWMDEEVSGIGTDSSSKGNYVNNSSLVVNGLYALHKLNITKDSTQWSSIWNVATKYKKSNGEIKTGSKSISQADRSNYEWADSTYDDTRYSSYTLCKEIATGSADTKIKNIYDMAGNMFEWTTETGNHVLTENPDKTGEGSYAVLRDGNFTYDGFIAPVSHRLGSQDAVRADLHIGFRVVLYVQDNKITNLKQAKQMGIQGKNVTLKADDKQTITIPAGFAVTKDSPTTADEGIVITDSLDNNGNSNGNEFVWVPCGTNGERYEFKNGLATTWRKNYSSRQWYYTVIPQNNTNAGKDIKDWRDYGGDDASVTKYEGFYVARFEAGVPSEAKDFYASKEGDAYKTNSAKDNSKYAPVSKKNNQSWNYISQKNAKKVSAKMYENSSSVTSQLIDSYAWDTIVEWMEAEEPGIGTDSTDYGNYSNNKTLKANGLYALHKFNNTKDSTKYASITDIATHYKKGALTTGSELITDRSKYEWADSTYDSEKYSSYTLYKEIATGSADTKIKNIYDMAGNMYEWTTETGSHGIEELSKEEKDKKTEGVFAVLRSGDFIEMGNSFPISTRNCNTETYGYSYRFGFRVVLYIK